MSAPVGRAGSRGSWTGARLRRAARLVLAARPGLATLAGLAALLVLPACGGEPAPSPPPVPHPPVSGRAYDLEGRPLVELPRVAGVNVAVIAFESAMPWPSEGAGGLTTVLPSADRWTNAASLLTGLLPSEHGVGADGATPSGYARAWTTAAEVLRSSYRYETAAFTSAAWPAAGAPLLQGFVSSHGPGDAAARVTSWGAGRTRTQPYFAFVLLAAPGPEVAEVRRALEVAGGGRPLLLVTTCLVGSDPATGPRAQPPAADDDPLADARVLVPLEVPREPVLRAWPSGRSQRALLDGVLARLGAPPLPGPTRASMEPGAPDVAVVEMLERTRIVAGVRGPRHTYGVVYDLAAGTVIEHLVERARPGSGERSDVGRLPSQGLDVAFCLAVEQVRDRLWGRVDDVAWRIASGYLSGMQAVPTARPAPLCAGPR